MNVGSRMVAVAAALSGALLWTAACSAAGMRAFENVPLSAVPVAIVAGQDIDVLEAGYLDVTKPPYSADPSGATDTSAAIQAAIHDGYQYNFAVYVPKGTYLLEHPIEMVQLYSYQGIGASNRKFANQLIGDTTGGDFPVLKAADGAIGNDVLVNIYFSGPQPETRHYNALIRGFVIDMGNNPNATALSLNGAQYCSIEDIVIQGESFDVGVLNLPGSGGSTTNLKVVGGNTGIWQSNYRPTPSVQGLELIGQSQRGIHHTNTRGSLILAGFRIEGSGAGYVAINTPGSAGSHPALNLVLVDGSIELSGGAQVAVDSRESSLYFRNLYVRAPVISRNGKRQPPTEELHGAANGWLHVGEYAFAGAAEQSPLVVDGVASGTADAEHLDGLSPVQGPPGNLLSRHAWNAASFPTWFNTDVLDVRDFGATPDQHGDDDAPAINQTLAASAAQGKPAFVPRGFFHTRSRIEVPAGAKVLGSSYTNSVIMASPQWLPNSHTAIVRTADAQGNVLMADFAINGHEGSALHGLQAHKNVTLFHGRTSGMLLRDVQINRREYWANGRAHFEAPAVRFSGNAGGRVYNLALDLHHASTEFMHPDHRMILVDGTHHPLAIYQPNAEGTENDPQTEIRDSSNVTWYGFKYESRDELLHILRSQDISILGGSGNYALTTDDSIIEVNDSSDVTLAILARQGTTGGYAFVREDGVVRVPGSRDLVTLYKKGAGGEEPPPPPENQPPMAAAGPNRSVETGELVQFNGSASSDPDGAIVAHAWAFGDGAQAAGAAVSHAYQAAGNYTVVLTVTDDDGASATDQVLVEVADAPPPPPENEPPTAVAGPDRSVETGELVQFNGSASSDPDGDIAAYGWTFGDGGQASGVTTSHAYQTAGDYAVVLTVTDDDGATATDQVLVEVADAPPPPENEAPTAAAGPDRSVETGEMVQFNGSASSDPDGTIVAYAWTFGNGAQASGATTSHAYQTAGDYTVVLTVTDDDGASATDQVLVEVEDAPPPPEQQTMQVASIGLTLEESSNNRCRAVAAVAVVDQDGAPLYNVAVTGRFEAVGYDREFTRRTDQAGNAVLVSGWRRPCPVFFFEVVNLRLGGYEFAENPVSSATASPG